MEERENNLVPTMAASVWEDIVVGDINIRAYFNAARDILFILDRTQDEILPNIILVMDSKDGRKWDDILPNDFNVDPEDVRPRAGNKYQKLDIDYESLRYYADAIKTGREDALSAVRIGIAERQKEFRMGEAHREIELAEATLLEAKKTVDDLSAFIKLQKDKLKAAKKNLGKEPPKASAAKILRYESRIEKAEAKKSRSMRRIRRAESRIDAARGLLSSYRNILLPRNTERKAAPQFDISMERIMNENDVKPLFTENPDIIDNDNAFRPVSFEPIPEAPRPAAAPMPEPEPAPEPRMRYVPEPAPEPRQMPQPIPQSTPMPAPSPFVAEQPAAAPAYRPASPMSADISRPMGPVSGADIKIEAANPEGGRPGGAYYLMLLLLIGLSIFTLYLYQKKMNSDALPHIAAVVPETVEPTKPAPTPAEPEPEPAAAPEAIPETIDEPLPEIAEPPAPADAPAEMPTPFAEPEPVPAPAPSEVPAIEPAAPVQDESVATPPTPEVIEETFEEAIEEPLPDVAEPSAPAEVPAEMPTPVAEPASAPSEVPAIEPDIVPEPEAVGPVSESALEPALGMPEPVLEPGEAEAAAEPEVIETVEFGEGVEE